MQQTCKIVVKWTEALHKNKAIEWKRVRTCHYSWCALCNGCRRWSHSLGDVLDWGWARRCFRENDLCVSDNNLCLSLTWLSAWTLLGQRCRFLIAWRHFECLYNPVINIKCLRRSKTQESSLISFPGWWSFCSFRFKYFTTRIVLSCFKYTST